MGVEVLDCNMIPITGSIEQEKISTILPVPGKGTWTCIVNMPIPPGTTRLKIIPTNHTEQRTVKQSDISHKWFGRVQRKSVMLSLLLKILGTCVIQLLLSSPSTRRRETTGENMPKMYYPRIKFSLV